MLSRVPESGRDLESRGADFCPHGLGKPNDAPRVGGVNRSRDRPLRGEPRQDGLGEILPDFVEAETPGFVFRIPPSGSKGGEMVVAIDHHGAIEIGDAGGVRGADQRVEGERRGPIASRESVDERPHSGGFVRDGHGWGGLVGGSGMMDFGNCLPGAPFARLVVVSTLGSMNTPYTESTVVTVETFRSLPKATMICRAMT